MRGLGDMQRKTLEKTTGFGPKNISVLFESPFWASVPDALAESASVAAELRSFGTEVAAAAAEVGGAGR